MWNEAFHEPFIFNKCGWDLLDSAHVWAHRADPDARLFINEYNVVAAGETERLYDIVKGMLDRKVPVHGIGVQCHFGDRQLNPNFIKKRLDRLGSLGLPIKITELDFGDWQKGMYFGEDEQARRYEMVLRIAFSHPAVEGIVLWGFWDGRHWVKNGGIVAMDGREKPAAKLIYDLWHKVWTTNGTFKADENGVVKFRGYPGKYKVTVDGKSEMSISDKTIFPGMKKSIPGILCLLAMPCSILIFVKVQALSGDLLALLAAVLFYIAVIVVCALVFNKPDPRNVPMEHPIIKDGKDDEPKEGE